MKCVFLVAVLAAAAVAQNDDDIYAFIANNPNECETGTEWVFLASPSDPCGDDGACEVPDSACAVNNDDPDNTRLTCQMVPDDCLTKFLEADQQEETTEAATEATTTASATTTGTDDGTTTAGNTDTQTTTAATNGATTTASNTNTNNNNNNNVVNPSQPTGSNTQDVGFENPLCCFWAQAGECDKNPYFMRPQCQSACGTQGCTVANAANCAVRVNQQCGQQAGVQPTNVGPSPRVPFPNTFNRPTFTFSVDRQPSNAGWSQPTNTWSQPTNTNTNWNRPTNTWSQPTNTNTNTNWNRPTNTWSQPTNTNTNWNRPAQTNTHQGANTVNMPNLQNLLPIGGVLFFKPRSVPHQPKPAPVATNTQPVVSSQVDNNQQQGGSCTDSQKDCGYWASIGECDKNPFYMKPNCGKSCNSCGTTVATVHAPQPKDGCTNSHELCQFWSERGECKVNPTYMNNSCKLSCNAC